MYCRKVDPLKTDDNDTYSVVAVPCLEDNYACASHAPPPRGAPPSASPAACRMMSGRR
jgi:hypothetical protein